MHGYVKLEANNIEEAPLQSRRAWTVCFSVRSTWVVVVFCGIVLGGLSLLSISDGLPILRAHAASKDHTLIRSIVNMMQVGMGQGAHQLGFHPRLQQPGFLTRFPSDGQSRRQAPQFQHGSLEAQHLFGEQHGWRQNYRGSLAGPRFAHEPIHGAAREVTNVRGLDIPVDGALISGEKRSAQRIGRLLTWVSAKLVLADMDKYTELDVTTPVATRIAQDSSYGDMIKLMEEVPLNDAEAWMKEAMKLNPILAMSLLDERKWCGSEFDYKLLSDMTQEHYEQTDKELMADYLRATGGLTNASVAGNDGKSKRTIGRSSAIKSNSVSSRSRIGATGIQVPAAAWESNSLSAEQRGMQQINQVLTWAGAKIIIAEIDGKGSDKQDPDSAALTKLKEVPLADADFWMREAMRLSPSLALRLMEERKKCASKFNFQLLSEFTQEQIVGEDKRLTANYDVLLKDWSIRNEADVEAARVAEEARKKAEAEAQAARLEEEAREKAEADAVSATKASLTKAPLTKASATKAPVTKAPATKASATNVLPTKAPASATMSPETKAPAIVGNEFVIGIVIGITIGIGIGIGIH